MVLANVAFAAFAAFAGLTAFAALRAVQADAGTFGDIMRHCFDPQVGPRINTDDMDLWLRQADALRRSRRVREFVVDTVDGRHVEVTETSFSDGRLC